MAQSGYEWFDHENGKWMVLRLLKALYHVHANTAGLHAPAAMGPSGRLGFDSSNYGLC
jgi:hypothetical protein